MSAEQAGPAYMKTKTEGEAKNENVNPEGGLTPEVAAAIIATVLGGRRRREMSGTEHFCQNVFKVLLYSGILIGLFSIFGASIMLILTFKPLPLLLGGWSLILFAALTLKSLGKQ